MQANLIIDGKHALGECVIWCDRTQSVFWTDIPARQLWNHRPTDGATRHWTLPERLSAFALTAQTNRLLVGLASRLAFFDLDSGAITPICDVEADLPTTRLNDGRCDRQGRFVFGTLNEHPGGAPIGGFYRLDADLRLQRLPLPDVAVSNSICFSPDGSRMYYCDTPQKRIMCCDYDSVTGAVGSQRLFVELADAAGSPDGATVDRHGYLWNAQWGGARVVRYAPDGQTERVIEMPVSQPSCAALGGADLNVLYVTTAHEGMTAQQRQSEPLAGGLFAVACADVRGLPETRFAG